MGAGAPFALPVAESTTSSKIGCAWRAQSGGLISALSRILGLPKSYGLGASHVAIIFRDPGVELFLSRTLKSPQRGSMWPSGEIEDAISVQIQHPVTYLVPVPLPCTEMHVLPQYDPENS